MDLAMVVFGGAFIYPQVMRNREKPDMSVSEVTSSVLAKLYTVFFVLLCWFAWMNYRGRVQCPNTSPSPT